MSVSYDSAIVPIAAGADLTGHAGKFVKVNSDNVTVVLSAAATDIVLGCIEAEAVSGGAAGIALCDGSGVVVPVKLAASPGTVVLGTYLTLSTDGTVLADPGSGNRVRVARALEAGAAGERINAVLITPTYIAAT